MRYFIFTAALIVAAAGTAGAVDIKNFDRNIGDAGAVLRLASTIEAQAQENCRAADDVAGMLGGNTGLAGQAYNQHSQVMANFYPGSNFSCAGRQGTIRVNDAQVLVKSGGKVYQVIYDRAGNGLTTTANIVPGGDGVIFRLADQGGNYVVVSQSTFGAGGFQDLKLLISMSGGVAGAAGGRGVNISTNELISVVNKLYDDALFKKISRLDLAARLLISQADREWLVKQTTTGGK